MRFFAIAQNDFFCHPFLPVTLFLLVTLRLFLSVTLRRSRRVSSFFVILRGLMPRRISYYRCYREKIKKDEILHSACAPFRMTPFPSPLGFLCHFEAFPCHPEAFLSVTLRRSRRVSKKEGILRLRLRMTRKKAQNDKKGVRR